MRTSNPIRSHVTTLSLSEGERGGGKEGRGEGRGKEEQGRREGEE